MSENCGNWLGLEKKIAFIMPAIRDQFLPGTALLKSPRKFYNQLIKTVINSIIYFEI